MTQKTLVFLDENMPPGFGKGLENQFGLDVLTVDDLNMRRAKDGELLDKIKEIKIKYSVEVILVTADKAFSRRYDKSIFISHKHSIKKPTPDRSKKYYKNQMYKDLVDELFQKGLIHLEKDGEPID